MNNLNRWYHLSILFYFISLVFIGYYSIQNQFASILIPSILAFIAFLILFKSIDGNQKLYSIIILIVVVKITIIFSFPHLSDDIYRFWWDGFLSCNGFNAYAFSPAEIISQIQDEKIIQSLQKHFKYLNSAEYYTIYPLVSQWIFRISAYWSGDNLYTFNLILKVIFFFADCIILFFLFKLTTILRIPKKNAILFYGNPLCIIELNINLHFEIFLILFLIISIFFFIKRTFLLSGLQLGLSIVSKLVSLFWIPLFIKRTFSVKSSFFFILGLLTPICLFLITVIPTLSNYQNSLSLYFQKFEFNSFLYKHLLDYLIYRNWSQAKALLSFVLIGIFCLAYFAIILKDWLKNNQGFSFSSAWLILFIYLLLSSTVHPWYLTPLIVLSVFAYWKTSVVWSFLIILSYARYDSLFVVYESYLIVLEYLTVLYFALRESRDPFHVIDNYTKK